MLSFLRTEFVIDYFSLNMVTKSNVKGLGGSVNLGLRAQRWYNGGGGQN